MQKHTEAWFRQIFCRCLLSSIERHNPIRIALTSRLRVNTLLRMHVREGKHRERVCVCVWLDNEDVRLRYQRVEEEYPCLHIRFDIVREFQLVNPCHHCSSYILVEPLMVVMKDRTEAYRVSRSKTLKTFRYECMNNFFCFHKQVFN